MEETASSQDDVNRPSTWGQPSSHHRKALKTPKHTATVYRPDCLANLLFGCRASDRLITFVRSWMMSALVATIFGLWSLHLIVFVASLRPHHIASRNGTYTYTPTYTPRYAPTGTEYKLNLATAVPTLRHSVEDEWPGLMAINFFLAVLGAALLAGSLNLPLCRRAYMEFQALFNVFNIIDWAWSFTVSHESGWYKPYLVTSLTVIVMIWNASDAMQVTNRLRIVMGVWLCSYWAVLYVLCELRLGFHDVDLFLGGVPGMQLSATVQHQRALFTLIAFMLKDVVAAAFYPRRCISIHGEVLKEWRDTCSPTDAGQGWGGITQSL